MFLILVYDQKAHKILPETVIGISKKNFSWYQSKVGSKCILKFLTEIIFECVPKYCLILSILFDLG